MQKLQNHSGSGVVTIPRGDLAKDDVLENDEIPEDQQADISRMGRRTYVVRIPEDGDLPELTECELVQRLAAQRALDLSATQAQPQAD